LLDRLRLDRRRHRPVVAGPSVRVPGIDVSEYVLYDRNVPGGWLWQRLTRRRPHAG